MRSAYLTLSNLVIKCSYSSIVSHRAAKVNPFFHSLQSLPCTSDRLFQRKT
jgi:hypothetical protein